MDADVEITRDELPSLSALLERLPQELYDEIYDLTFTAQPGISSVSKHPDGASEEGRKKRQLYLHPDSVNLLHVDLHSRNKFAASYYRGKGAVFICDHSDRVVLEINSWDVWLWLLNAAHMSLLKDVRCVLTECNTPRLQDGIRRFQRQRTESEKRESIRTLCFDAGEVNVKIVKEDQIAAELARYCPYSAHGLRRHRIPISTSPL